ncbi:MAG: hypothetical protein OXN84_01910 [Albidovulum sp.]|nr:hypothetical protein [Albidovulum sp.]
MNAAVRTFGAGANGSQSLGLQYDALIANSVGKDRIYSDRASGRTDERP